MEKPQLPDGENTTAPNADRVQYSGTQDIAGRNRPTAGELMLMRFNPRLIGFGIVGFSPLDLRSEDYSSRGTENSEGLSSNDPGDQQ